MVQGDLLAHNDQIYLATMYYPDDPSNDAMDLGDVEFGSDQHLYFNTVAVFGGNFGGDPNTEGNAGVYNAIASGQTGTQAITAAFAADDTIVGASHNDTLEGFAGNDYIEGYDGNDILKGDDGNDTLLGEKGDDILIGGKGSDTFVFSDLNSDIHGGFGHDTIQDFGKGDKIDVSDVSEWHNFHQLNITQSGSNAVITDGEGDTITLVGIQVSSLTAKDFIFAARALHAAADISAGHMMLA